MYRKIDSFIFWVSIVPETTLEKQIQILTGKNGSILQADSGHYSVAGHVGLKLQSSLTSERGLPLEESEQIRKAQAADELRLWKL